MPAGPLKEEAKKRQVAGLKRGNEFPVPPVPAEREQITGEAIIQAAELVGGGGGSRFKSAHRKGPRGTSFFARAGWESGRRLDAMPGPAKSPRTLRLLKGTLQRCRDDAPEMGLPMIDGVPTPPSWMTNLDAVKEFQRLAPILAANRLLTQGNVPILGQYCAMHGRLVEMWAAKMTPTASFLNAFRAFANGLGLTSMRLPAVPTTKPNIFAENAKRRHR
jgi:hypothetical protein